MTWETLAFVAGVGVVVLAGWLVAGAPRRLERMGVRGWFRRELRWLRPERGKPGKGTLATALLAASLVGVVGAAAITLRSQGDGYPRFIDTAPPPEVPGAPAADLPGDIRVPKVNSPRDPGTGHGRDPAAERACEQLSGLLSAAKRGELKIPAVKRTVRGWGNLKVRNHAYIQAGAHFIHDDVFLTPPAPLEVIVQDIGRMKRDCARAGFR